ncbi:nitrite reductase small subunit NirD [Pseudonocardia phyllosphaerae]|uniref:nitrite reductase small subunit NirD n=1 Tax=Pseudonocardia phyllosphaerae TaxID=3390502 RepID=UPI00397C1D6D
MTRSLPTTQSADTADPADTAAPAELAAEALPGDVTGPGTHAPATLGEDVRDWLPICALDRLQPNRGAAALVGDVQVAVFRLPTGPEAPEGYAGALFAVGNIDPFSGAGVMSRGLVGDRGGEPTVASPIYKQKFALRDGRCLDDDTVSLPAFHVRDVGGEVQVGIR